MWPLPMSLGSQSQLYVLSTQWDWKCSFTEQMENRVSLAWCRDQEAAGTP